MNRINSDFKNILHNELKSMLADVKWSDNTAFPEAASLNGTEELVGLKSGNNMKANLATKLLPYVGANIAGAPYTLGDLFYAASTSTFGRIADIAIGNALISGGVGAAPSFGKIGLTTHVSGILPSANGGTGINNGSSTITIGGNIQFSGANTFNGTLTGNTSVTFPTSGTLATDLQSAFNNGTGVVTTTVGKPVAVVSTGFTAVPDNSSLFDAQSITQGVRLFPGMTITQRNAISSPAAQLTVYNNTYGTQDYYDGTTWQNIATLNKLLAGDNMTLTQNGDGTMTFAANMVTPGGTSDLSGQSAINNTVATTIAASNTYYPIHVSGTFFNDIDSSNFVNEFHTISGIATPCMRYTDDATQEFQINWNIFAKGAVPSQQQYDFTLCVLRAGGSIITSLYTGTVILQDLIFPQCCALTGFFSLSTGDRIFVQVRNPNNAQSVYVTDYNAIAVNVDASANAAIKWNDITATSAAMLPQNGYVSDNSSRVTLTLPTVANFGSEMRICGKGTGGFTIAQNLGQSINVGNLPSTTGAGGSISSTNQFDSLILTCIVANTTWNAYGVQGNLTVV
jgi:hypothetical protein